MLDVVWAHPLDVREGHVAQRRVETVNVPVEDAVVARHDLSPGRDLDGRLALDGRRRRLARPVLRRSGASTAIAQDGGPFRVLEAERVAVFGEAAAAREGDKMERPSG